MVHRFKWRTSDLPNETSVMELPVLLSLLNNHYLNGYNTQIIGGFNEPFYQAAIENKPAQIQYSHDYIRSALHELAHWCVAGVERRKQDDYGYWYAEDGRTQQQQNAFYQVEVKPQAIECAFSLLLGVEFEPSVDNLNNEVEGAQSFERSMYQQLVIYINNGFPKRAGEILALIAQDSGIDDHEGVILQKLKRKNQVAC